MRTELGRETVRVFIIITLIDSTIPSNGLVQHNLIKTNKQKTIISSQNEKNTTKTAQYCFIVIHYCSIL